MNRIFIVNVGVNARHGAARSRLYPDGTFEWIPIPETEQYAGAHSVRYGDLPQWHGDGSLADLLPPGWATKAAHADPDFAHGTYGDECQRTTRARGLLRAREGDWLYFLSRLVPRDGSQWGAHPVFALVGVLRIARVIHDVTSPPAAASGTLAKNAHFRRAFNNPAGWDGFSVFVGSQETGRFRRACMVDKPFARRFLRDAGNRPFAWPRHRSPLQIIGSYTRTCRCVLDPAEWSHRHRYAAFTAHMAPFLQDLAAPPAV